MLRRVATVAATRGRFACAGLLASAAATPLLSAPTQLHARWASTAAAETGSSSSSSSNATANNRNYNSSRGRQPARRTPLPPAFDIVHWNDEKPSEGFLLRVLYRNGYIALDYHRQKTTTENSSSNNTAEAATPGRRENRAVKVVTVTLPPVYVARFLGVLEGRMDKVEVQSRFTNATFAPNGAKGKHCHTLHCVSTKPTTGQAQTVEGADVDEATVEWTAELDAAESLMLHRFLTQALHQNTGFGRTA
uniref:27 kDa guide RNA-binding protein n=1 Tax=Crithidia fasciculata TaxID=5656 RepID=Q9MI65_CRIFA|nr:27 kDa guide RNA-binding protein [Crithidia fasciculata]